MKKNKRFLGLGQVTPNLGPKDRTRSPIIPYKCVDSASSIPFSLHQLRSET